MGLFLAFLLSAAAHVAVYGLVGALVVLICAPQK
jgi:hypothetical protein